ncbi:unnamed protein product, partial [Staurois parvus]
MAECGDGDSSTWEAVRDPWRHSGPGQQLMSRRYRGPMTDLRAWQQQWEARNLPATLWTNWNPPASVRRPESGT